MQLAERWTKDNKVTVLTRNVQGSADNTYGMKERVADVQMLPWDAKTLGDWTRGLEGCDLLLNLAGKTVNCRYNEKNKQEIMSSRVDATRVLGEAVKRLKQPPALWINGASTTIYRHADDRPQDEFTGEMESDFSVQVCKAWEAAFNAIEVPATRKVVLRMAIVLGEGGVLVPYSWLARLGVGGKHGNGRQMFSWVHIDDLCEIVEWLYENKEASGVYNAAAPGPVPNQQFMGMLRDIYKMPVGIPAPKWLLEIAAFIHGTETELLLKSRWVLPSRLLQEGYIFKHSKLQDALKDLLR
jgi:uncharacterized protein (TIGR01777 family)